MRVNTVPTDGKLPLVDSSELGLLRIRSQRPHHPELHALRIQRKD